MNLRDWKIDPNDPRDLEGFIKLIKGHRCALTRIKNKDDLAEWFIQHGYVSFRDRGYCALEIENSKGDCWCTSEFKSWALGTEKQHEGEPGLIKTVFFTTTNSVYKLTFFVEAR